MNAALSSRQFLNPTLPSYRNRCAGAGYTSRVALRISSRRPVKNINLAVSDVTLQGEAFVKHHGEHTDAGIDGCSVRALAPVWKAARFSWWFTSVTHRSPTLDGLNRRMRMAEFDYIRGSEAAQRTLAENYVGLPIISA